MILNVLHIFIYIHNCIAANTQILGLVNSNEILGVLRNFDILVSPCISELKDKEKNNRFLVYKTLEQCLENN